MRIVCAPDSFKETIGATDVAEAMAAGVMAAQPAAEVDRCPIADGGEGSLAVFVAAAGGEIRSATVTGPLGSPVLARYGVLGDGRTGIVEMAEASGLALVPAAQRDPTRTTTFGTGELIRRAAEDGCDTVIVFLGGSATCDGGTGIAQALGAIFRDDAGRTIDSPMTGGHLAAVRAVAPATDAPRLIAAADVTNPLTGADGAAAVYGPQKGGTPAQTDALDAALAHLARLAGGAPLAPGAGAAGGTGYGLAALCGAALRRGVDVIIDAVGLERRCRGASLVITGEGRLDAQSLDGKACLGVADAARRAGAPTVAVVGTTGPGVERCRGLLIDVESLAARYGNDRALRAPGPLITDTVRERLAHWLRRSSSGD